MAWHLVAYMQAAGMVVCDRISPVVALAGSHVLQSCSVAMAVHQSTGGSAH